MAVSAAGASDRLAMLAEQTGNGTRLACRAAGVETEAKRRSARP